MRAEWVPHDVRDSVMDFAGYWRERCGFPASQFIEWLGIGAGKFYEWKKRYGKVNEHNGKIPRDYWLLDNEKRAIIDYYLSHPGEGYRRLTYMMLDADVAAVSAASVYRVLKEAGVMRRWNGKPSQKGTGFEQPLSAHEHWHADVSYINICGTFYYLISILDGMSRFIVHWDIRESMKEADVELILQKAKEKYPNARPRIISDNGPQFISKDFKEFVRISGMTHVRTSSYYPQSNGKIERWHQSVKRECIRPKTPLSLADAKRIVGGYVAYYNNVRLHSAIGYVTPTDKLNGCEKQIWEERDRKLEMAREMRKARRAASRVQAVDDLRTGMLN